MNRAALFVLTVVLSGFSLFAGEPIADQKPATVPAAKPAASPTQVTVAKGIVPAKTEKQYQALDQLFDLQSSTTKHLPEVHFHGNFSVDTFISVR